MPKPIPKEVGLAEALVVAEGDATPRVGESDAKLLGFFLRDGECTAEISESKISVWYSWLPRPKPSPYDVCLAPGLMCRLMELGEVQRIADETTFQVRTATQKTKAQALRLLKEIKKRHQK